MRNKIMIIAVLLAVMAAMTGIAAASEGLMASWTGTQIKAEAWDFLVPSSGPQYYQIRYYEPGQFNPPNYNSGVYYTNPKFIGYAIYDSSNHYVDSPLFTPTMAGTWTVALFKDGTVFNDDGTIKAGDVPNSFKVSVPLDVPIPEFSTVAIPIAAVLGLVFFFQQRKKKEE